LISLLRAAPEPDVSASAVPVPWPACWILLDRRRKSGPARVEPGQGAADDFPDISFSRALSACIGVHLLVSAL